MEKEEEERLKAIERERKAMRKLEKEKEVLSEKIKKKRDKYIVAEEKDHAMLSEIEEEIRN